MAHQDAVIVNAAVSSAIAASFGKDKGGFKRFLSQFKIQHDPQHTRIEAVETPEGIGKQEQGDLDGWEDF